MIDHKAIVASLNSLVRSRRIDLAKIGSDLHSIGLASPAGHDYKAKHVIDELARGAGVLASSIDAATVKSALKAYKEESRARACSGAVFAAWKEATTDALARDILDKADGIVPTVKAGKSPFEKALDAFKALDPNQRLKAYTAFEALLPAIK